MISSWMILQGAGMVPDLSRLARSSASLASKAPDMEELPVGISSFTRDRNTHSRPSPRQQFCRHFHGSGGPKPAYPRIHVHGNVGFTTVLIVFVLRTGDYITGKRCPAVTTGDLNGVHFIKICRFLVPGFVIGKADQKYLKLRGKRLR